MTVFGNVKTAVQVITVIIFTVVVTIKGKVPFTQARIMQPIKAVLPLKEVHRAVARDLGKAQLAREDNANSIIEREYH